MKKSKKVLKSKRSTPRGSLTAAATTAQGISDGYHHGDLKRTLIDAALKLLETRSPAELSLRDLAKKAGVSQAAPYRHFKNKEELLAEICVEAFQLKYDFMKRAMSDAKGDARQTYFGLGLAYFEMGLRYPQHLNLMFGSQCQFKTDYPALQEIAMATFVLVRQMAEICQKAGLFGKGDPYQRALHCWIIVHGFSALYAAGKLEWLGIDGKNAREALQVMLDQFLVGAKTDLAKSETKFELFKRNDSVPFKKMMDQWKE